MVYKHILVGYDGSEASKKAVQKALDLAKVLGAKLHLVTVVPSPVPLVGELLVPEVITVSEILESAEKTLAKLAQEIESTTGLPVEYTVAEGDPAEEIVETAKRCGCDLIVVGRRGAGRLERLLLGSVSEKVVKITKGVDVLVVETRR
ncbi:MAG: universal stress protein [Crenarchaeota archaeon]|nr:universal stress protein [Thermoproteota archaeon]